MFPAIPNCPDDLNLGRDMNFARGEEEVPMALPSLRTPAADDAEIEDSTVYANFEDSCSTSNTAEELTGNPLSLLVSRLEFAEGFDERLTNSPQEENAIDEDEEQDLRTTQDGSENGTTSPPQPGEYATFAGEELSEVENSEQISALISAGNASTSGNSNPVPIADVLPLGELATNSIPPDMYDISYFDSIGEYVSMFLPFGSNVGRNTGPTTGGRSTLSRRISERTFSSDHNPHWHFGDTCCCQYRPRMNAALYSRTSRRLFDSFAISSAGSRGRQLGGILCRICDKNIMRRRPTMTRCGHFFCEFCIRGFSRLSPKCPICNVNISVHPLVRVYV